MYVYHVGARCLRRSEEGIRCPGTGVMGSCELPCGSFRRAARAHNHQPLLLPPGVSSYNIFGVSTFWLALCTWDIFLFLWHNVSTQKGLFFFFAFSEYLSSTCNIKNLRAFPPPTLAFVLRVQTQ